MPKKPGTKPLSQKEIDKIRDMHMDGRTIAAIVKATGRCPGSVFKVIKSREDDSCCAAAAPHSGSKSTTPSTAAWISYGLANSLLQMAPCDGRFKVTLKEDVILDLLK